MGISIVKPWESPYAGFSNNPIYFADPSGLDPEDTNGGGNSGGEGGGDGGGVNKKNPDDYYQDKKGNPIEVNIPEVTATANNNNWSSEVTFDHVDINPIDRTTVKGCKGDCGPANDYFDTGFLRMLNENFSIEAEYSVELGSGEANINRFFGYELNQKGIKSFVGVKVFSVSNKNHSSFYEFDASPYAIFKYSYQTVEFHTKLNSSLVNKDLTGEIGGALFGVYLDANYNFVSKKFESNTGFSIIDVSKKIPNSKYGSNAVHNFELKANFRLSNFTKEWFK